LWKTLEGRDGEVTQCGEVAVDPGRHWCGLRAGLLLGVGDGVVSPWRKRKEAWEAWELL
jgi:hypothetical protein